MRWQIDSDIEVSEPNLGRLRGASSLHPHPTLGNWKRNWTPSKPKLEGQDRGVGKGKESGYCPLIFKTIELALS